MRKRFNGFNASKTFLIRLVSALGFGGMVGFCILSCEIAVAYGPPPFEEGMIQADQQDQQRDEVADAEADPLEERAIEQSADALESSSDALEGVSADGVLPSTDGKDGVRDQAQKYGVRRPNP